MEYVESTPNKTYQFNEVTGATGVKPYVLRFWESEFEQINPQKLNNGDRVYSEDDLAIVNKVKTLLFDEKMSIQEAKNSLRQSEHNQALTLEEKTQKLKAAFNEEIHAQKKAIKVAKLDHPRRQQSIKNRQQARQLLAESLTKIEDLFNKYNW
jgi:DNA-binding transcriptional MerR regulator